jgi:type IV secretory pathway VirB2 component (pilin)
MKDSRNVLAKLLGSKKATVTLLVLIICTVGLFTGFIPSGDFLSAVKVIVGVYCGSQALEDAAGRFKSGEDE